MKKTNIQIMESKGVYYLIDQYGPFATAQYSRRFHAITVDAIPDTYWDMDIPTANDEFKRFVKAAITIGTKNISYYGDMFHDWTVEDMLL